MSEEQKPTDSDEKNKEGQGPHEPNNDKTVIRGQNDRDSAATIMRGPISNARATILRAPSEDGSGDATIIRAPQPNMDRTIIRGAADDKTVIRDTPQAESGAQAAPPAASGGADDKTVIRDVDEDRTVVRENDATVMRDSDADATVMRAGDDDATIINQGAGGDADATVIGDAGLRNSDTTYIASVGKQIESKGNSEAGRLLKNRFVLEEKLGSGGMGDVYKALDLRAQEAQEKNPYIAIKVLNENFSRHKDAFVALQREASKTRGIPHPNIMGVYDFDREGDTVYMSMELLNGKPLDDYLKEHPEGVSVEDAWTIIHGICEGLGRAHGAGIVHSDFKPGNIFYCSDKTAKVFDFGIARAVKSPGDIQADGEKTVFDAGSLGALTPTYASYEMLKGMEPSKSDDVYAVALVAYELFTGRHPYDRTPADKAYERGMKPEPVTFLKRRQWRALRKALELKGEDRTQSLDEFQEAMFAEDPPYFRYAAIAAVLLGSVGFGAYNLIYGGVEEIPVAVQDARGEYTGALTRVEDQMRNISWDTDLWHENLNTSMLRLTQASIDLEEQSEWVDEVELAQAKDSVQKKKAEVFKAYHDKLRSEINSIAALPKTDWETVKGALVELERVGNYLNHAQEKKFLTYGDRALVATVETQYDATIQSFTDWNVRYQEEEDRRIAQAEAEEAARLEAEAIAEAELIKVNTYKDHLADLTDILRCKGNIPSGPGDPNYRPPSDNTRVDGDELALLGATLDGLRTTYPERWEYDYENIAKAIAGCIVNRIGIAKPDRAREVQSVVMTYLPDEPLIANISINDVDPCAERNLIGRGARSRRFCQDRLFDDVRGPELVVIPPLEATEQQFAISKFEIKVGDFNQFCEAEGCQPLPGSPSLPATNLTLAQAESYTKWLSEVSGKVYRLPLVAEWKHAASTDRNEGKDPNVNCTVDSRGVTRGDKMATAESGRSNGWGLFHYVGNAREWALDEDGNVYALGGARTDPIAECGVGTSVAHTGEPDPVTGFRILRQISSS